MFFLGGLLRIATYLLWLLLLGGGTLAPHWAAAQSPAAASPSPPVLPYITDVYGAVFNDWVKRRDPENAVLTVRRGGKTVFIKGHNVDPSEPTMVASLSKPITGACIATLIRDGKLNFKTPMREALAKFFILYGPPLDRRLELVTIEQLLMWWTAPAPGNELP